MKLHERLIKAWEDTADGMHPEDAKDRWKVKDCPLCEYSILHNEPGQDSCENCPMWNKWRGRDGGYRGTCLTLLNNPYHIWQSLLENKEAISIIDELEDE